MRGPAYMLLFALAAIDVVNVLTIAVTYWLYPGYLDTGEPNIVALAWRLLDGHPVYLPIDAAERTTNLYGPYLYLIHAAVFSVFGASVAVGKSVGLLAFVGAFLAIACAQKDRGPVALAIALSLTGGIAVLNLPASIWDRPEAFMLLSVAVGVLINNMSRDDQKWLRVVAYAVLIGFVMGLKVFAAIYFLPFGLWMLYRDGIVAAAMTAALALVVTALPYAFDAFNLTYMLDLINVMAGKPNALHELLKVVRYAGVYVLPVLISIVVVWRHIGRDERRQVLVLSLGALAAMALVLYPAQKPGAGMYYLLPFAPIAADLTARCLNHGKACPPVVWGALGLCLLAVIIAVPSEKRFFRALDFDMAQGVASEIQNIAADYPDKTIEIGIGHTNDSYRRTYQRTRLVFDGHPYTLDTSIIVDTTAWGIDLTPETIAMMETCRTDIWLIPASERPYAWIGYYGQDTYGRPFRDSFNRSYVKLEGRKYFDVYGCAKPGN